MYYLSYIIIGKNIIELDSYYIIEQVKFSKTSENSFNYLLGIFEATNYSTFFGTLPIGMIKETDVLDSKNNELSINIEVPNLYKYIKYNPPKSIGKEITNIKIYWHNYSDEEDLSGKTLFKVTTNLPLMIINTKNYVEPSSFEYYIDSKIIIINENNIKLNETASIRLRGYTTSLLPKKLYKIKFEKKQKILGFSGKYKK